MYVGMCDGCSQVSELLGPLVSCCFVCAVLFGVNMCVFVCVFCWQASVLHSSESSSVHAEARARQGRSTGSGKSSGKSSEKSRPNHGGAREHPASSATGPARDGAVPSLMVAATGASNGAGSLSAGMIIAPMVKFGCACACTPDLRDRSLTPSACVCLPI